MDKEQARFKIAKLDAMANDTSVGPQEAALFHNKAAELRRRFGITVAEPTPLAYDINTFKHSDPVIWDYKSDINYDSLIPDEYVYDNEDGDW
jgi:hypothetical protein